LTVLKQNNLKPFTPASALTAIVFPLCQQAGNAAHNRLANKDLYQPNLCTQLP